MSPVANWSYPTAVRMGAGRISEIAEACNSSANHLAQVVNTLHANGYLNATRGRMGGVSLARSASSINIGAVFRLFEADVPFTECSQLETNTCPLVSACRLKLAIRRALEAFYREMDLVTLEDLVVGNGQLEELFRMSDMTDALACPASQNVALRKVSAG